MRKFDLIQNPRLRLPVELLTLDLVLNQTVSVDPTVVEHLFEAVEGAGRVLDVAAPVELLLVLDLDWSLMLPNVDLTIDLTIDPSTRVLTNLSPAMEHTGLTLDTDRDPNLNPNLSPKSPNLNPRILLDCDHGLDVRQLQKLDAVETVEAPDNEPPRDPVDRIDDSSSNRRLCPCLLSPSSRTAVDHNHLCLDP